MPLRYMSTALCSYFKLHIGNISDTANICLRDSHSIIYIREGVQKRVEFFTHWHTFPPVHDWTIPIFLDPPLLVKLVQSVLSGK